MTIFAFKSNCNTGEKRNICVGDSLIVSCPCRHFSALISFETSRGAFDKFKQWRPRAKVSTCAKFRKGTRRVVVPPKIENGTRFRFRFPRSFFTPSGLIFVPASEGTSRVDGGGRKEWAGKIAGARKRMI